MSDDNGRLEETGSESPVEKPQRNRFLQCLINNRFMLSIIAGVLIGFAIGFGLRQLPRIDENLKVWISMPGDIYIRLLKLTILPLIASNVIIVIAKLDPEANGKISTVAFIYIVFFNILGASIGTAAAAAIGPGRFAQDTSGSRPPKENEKAATTSDVFADLFLNIFPDNIVGIALYQAVTSYVYIGKNNETNEPMFRRNVGTDDGTNMIGVIFVCVTFGLAASAAKERGIPFLEFFASLADVVLKLIRAFLQLTPIGVCFMIAGAVIKVDDIKGNFAKLGIFVATVVVGIAVLAVFEVLFYFACTRKNPFTPIRHLSRAWFIVFATTSALVGVPEIIEGCDEMGVRRATSRFVAPLAATLKADGSAVFIAASSVFITQMEGLGDNSGKIVVIWLLTSALVIAIPHIPSSSIVIILTVLSSVGVPVEQVSLLYATEWLLDRIRSGMSCASTFYCVIYTEYMTIKKGDANVDEDDYDMVMSELSKADSLKSAT
ncbi:Excitatory amino acid transporter 2 [Echinococcus granulosus]|nr:Excitatory amino acid transporter 2 [Echinococcus granulosus]